MYYLATEKRDLSFTNTIQRVFALKSTGISSVWCEGIEALTVY